MSVYKSQQHQAAIKFVSEARNFRIETIRTLKHFPNSYRYIFVNKMLEMAADIYINCNMANAIFVHKDMSVQDFELRHRYLTVAYVKATALLCEISFCYDFVNMGNNFFKDGYDYGKRFENWIKAGNAAKSLIKGVIEADRKKFKAEQT